MIEKIFFLLFFLLPTLLYSIPQCPNNCSNIGQCYQGICACPEGFYGGDCSLKNCPVSESWADKAVDDEQAHSYVECSNQGICDAKKGKCHCFSGFEGEACERSSCGTIECSGHGQCFTSKELYQYYNSIRDSSISLQNSPTNVYFNTEAHYDYPSYSNIINSYQFTHPTACHCEMGYGGPDCSYVLCPRGTDPLYLVDVDASSINYPTYTLTIDTLNFDTGILRLGLLSETFFIQLPIADWTTIYTTIKDRFESFQLIDEFILVSHSFTTTIYTLKFSLKFDFLKRYENNVFIPKAIPEPIDFICDTNSIQYTSNAPAANNCVITRDSISDPYHHADICSSRGVCNYDTGVCDCFDLFYGEACQKFLGNTEDYIQILPEDVLNLRIDSSLDPNLYKSTVLKLDSAYNPPDSLYWLKIMAGSKQILNINNEGLFNLMYGGFYIEALGFNKGVHILEGSSSALGGIVIEDDDANIKSISIADGGSVYLQQGNAECEGISAQNGGSITSDGKIISKTGPSEIEGGGLLVDSGSINVSGSSSLTGSSYVNGDITATGSLSIQGDVNIKGLLNLASSITVEKITTGSNSLVGNSLKTKSAEIISGGLLVHYNTITPNLNQVADMSVAGNTYFISTSASFDDDFSTNADFYTSDIDVANDISVGDSISIEDDFIIGDDSNFGSGKFKTLSVDDISIGGSLTSKNLKGNTLSITDESKFSLDLKLSGDLTIQEDLTISSIIPIFLNKVVADAIEAEDIVSYSELTTVLDTSTPNNLFSQDFTSQYKSVFDGNLVSKYVKSSTATLTDGLTIITGDLVIDSGSVKVNDDLTVTCDPAPTCFAGSIIGNTKSTNLEVNSILSSDNSFSSNFKANVDAKSVETFSLSTDKLVYDVPGSSEITANLLSSASINLSEDLIADNGKIFGSISATSNTNKLDIKGSLYGNNMLVNSLNPSSNNEIQLVRTGSISITGSEVKLQDIEVIKGGIYISNNILESFIEKLKVTITEPQFSKINDVKVKENFDLSSHLTVSNFNVPNPTSSLKILQSASAFSLDAGEIHSISVVSARASHFGSNTKVSLSSKFNDDVDVCLSNKIITPLGLASLDATCLNLVETNCLLIPFDINNCYNELSASCKATISIGCQTTFTLTCLLSLDSTCLSSIEETCSTQADADCIATSGMDDCLFQSCISTFGDNNYATQHLNANSLHSNNLNSIVYVHSDEVESDTIYVKDTVTIYNFITTTNSAGKVEVRHTSKINELTSNVISVSIVNNNPSFVNRNALVLGNVIATTFTNLSDKRLKTNIEIIPSSLSTVKNLTGITFVYNELYNQVFGKNSKNLNINNETHSGVLAQDVQATFPIAVEEIKDYLSVNYISLIPVLINSLQELSIKYEEISTVSSTSVDTISSLSSDTLCSEDYINKLSKLEEMLTQLEQENKELEDMLKLLTSSS